MNASLRKIGALVAKDFIDFFKNPTMSAVCLMPVAFMAFYRFVMGDAAASAGASEADMAANPEFATFMIGAALCMTIGMVGSMTVLYGIAEEKEKHTLRTLMLANVSAGQAMAAKSIVAIAVIVAVEIICFFVADGQMQWFAPYMALGIAGAVPVVLISLVLGLACRDQMTAGLYSVPVLLLTLVPMFGMLSEDIGRVAQFTPCGGVYDLMSMAIDGSLASPDAIAPAIVTLAWIIAGAALFAVLFKRLARDN